MSEEKKGKHTPGEWHTGTDEDAAAWGPMVYAGGEDEIIVADCQPVGFDIADDDEAAANAALIAQAPTLLAQRDALAEALAEYVAAGLDFGKIRRAEDRARAALAAVGRG